MKQWMEHSIRGYLTRLPSYKLELILHGKRQSERSVLTEEDYRFIEDLLRDRRDSSLFQNPKDSKSK